MAPTSPHSCIILELLTFQNEITGFADAIIEQLIIFGGIDTHAAQSLGFDGLRLNHEIAWRIRRRPLFYKAD